MCSIHHPLHDFATVGKEKEANLYATTFYTPVIVFYREFYREVVWICIDWSDYTVFFYKLTLIQQSAPPRCVHIVLATDQYESYLSHILADQS